MLEQKPVQVVLSGSFRKDPAGLKAIYKILADAGCKVLSPSSVDYEGEEAGFVFMRGESGEEPGRIERRTLSAIDASEFVWLFAPNGYVGPSAALEIGYAYSAGIPIFSDAIPSEPVLASFVTTVPSPNQAIETVHYAPPPKSIPAMQHYYQRVAVQRGYADESARDCLLLMVEEVGELARTIRKGLKLARHHEYAPAQSLELADVFLYVIHLANILQIDLTQAVTSKEAASAEQFLQALAKQAREV